jgi:hypothetical protein
MPNEAHVPSLEELQAYTPDSEPVVMTVEELGWTFKLRPLQDLTEVRKLFTRLDEVRRSDFRVSNEEVDMDELAQLIALSVVLEEPKLTLEEIFDLKKRMGVVFFRLGVRALELSGLLGMEAAEAKNA